MRVGPLLGGVGARVTEGTDFGIGDGAAVWSLVGEVLEGFADGAGFAGDSVRVRVGWRVLGACVAVGLPVLGLPVLG
jgi:hypothetical protein